MNFQDAIKSGFQPGKYAPIYPGRSTRSEFWYWILFVVIGAVLTFVLDRIVIGSYQPFHAIFSLAVTLPTYGVGARRLHDIGRSGWWQLLHFVLIIGTIILIIWWCQRGQPGSNRYGSNPLEV